MIPQRELDDLKSACARIRRGRALLGTGYLVAPRLLATCHHVVASSVDDDLSCAFGERSRVAVAGRVLRWDRAHDTALVELGSDAPMRPLQLAADPDRGELWECFGFPGFADPQGVPLDGTVKDARSWDTTGERPAILLFSPEFSAELPADVGGFSGSPVLGRKGVVGHLFRVLGAADGPKKPRFGYSYAVPAWAVRELLRATGRGEVTADVRGPADWPEAPPDATAARAAAEEAAGLLDRLLRARDPGAVDAVLAPAGEARPTDPELLAVAELFIAMGLLDEAAKVLDRVQPQPRVHELRALASSLQGRHEEALKALDALPGGVESAGIAGGVLKRLYLSTCDGAWLERAHRRYADAYRSTGDVYLGVNAAALALWRGDRPEAIATAGHVRDRLRQLAEDGSHWDWATLGEAELLVGDRGAAREAYRRAAKLAGPRLRDIAVMRKQARLDAERLGASAAGEDPVDAWFPPTGIACLAATTAAGELDPATARSVRATLRAWGVRLAFGSGVRGADLEALEQVLAGGGTATLFLPSPAGDFAARWLGGAWTERFDRLPTARRFVATSGDAARPFTGSDAALRRAVRDAAALLDTTPILLAVPPPHGAQDERDVAGAVDAWNEERLGPVVTLQAMSGPQQERCAPSAQQRDGGSRS